MSVSITHEKLMDELKKQTKTIKETLDHSAIIQDYTLKSSKKIIARRGICMDPHIIHITEKDKHFWAIGVRIYDRIIFMST